MDFLIQTVIYTQSMVQRTGNGGLSNLSLKNKFVLVIANSQAGDCCLVIILDYYFQKLPEHAKMEDLFYM